MQERTPTDNQFAIDLLATLRQEGFRPFAWWNFLARSWEMSCSTARTYPSLKRSWIRTTLFIAMLSSIVLVVNIVLEGTGAVLRLLPGFALCMLWQQSDLFWHLGLNRQTRTGTILQHIGIANILTELRGLCAGYLLGRLSGGLITPDWLALSLYLCGIVTDILDGQVARLTKAQSRLGQLLDGEIDFSLSVAIALILVQNNMLPLWLGMVMLLRFCIPLFAALVSYFCFARPVRFGSTFWGRCAGVVQCLYLLMLLAPPQFALILQPIHLPLLVILLLLLIAAPLAQIAANISVW